MDVLASGRLNPYGFLHVHCAPVKLERKDCLRNRSNLNRRVSSRDMGSTVRFSASPEFNFRSCILQSKSSAVCKGQTLGCRRNLYSQTSKSLTSRDGSSRVVDTRGSSNHHHFHRKRMKCLCHKVTEDWVCHLCSTAVNSCSGFPLGASRNSKSHLDQRVNFRLENVRTSNNFIRNRNRASLYNIRTSSARADVFLERNPEVMGIAGVSSPTLGLLPFRTLRQKRRSPYVCHADSGASDNMSESPPKEDEIASKGASTSPIERFFAYVKQVDWMDFIFKWQKDEPLWNVPWTGHTIFQVMVLWFAAFWVMGSWIIPIAAQLAGFSRHTLSFRGQALYSLITDIAEGTVGIWILKRCLARFLPLPEGWFPINLKGKWLVEACWGCLLFPLVNKLSQLNLFLLPLPTPLTTSYVEQSMMSRDPVATLLYAVVISVCAPVWEEVIFRGFLLPSMTRYLPLWGAISVSALAFALAHFSMQRILPLTFLGLVMGFVFVRSRNLLASIVLHSLWNGFAFLELL
ncbi:CAAX protease family protein [Marchantia polymorpha subsp. ruderalis]|uniref:CAAX prenyl protease 2/Lysostaphin resistance protein A-like domain-containing protein n=2 Tax=Marchantia polymorpha TaxID=3197 RepID=A0A176VGJ5_MARPO|nr:hypothetical protein AXG93_960s1300 [Marchantia polymorpha subsp. ruderalis]PTQ28803.1 hypothetical protein MARPO_0154s0029 [Marchantia polymorpha]BBN20090.1 hypothetical protein Mp_8g16350 [Marchantia polymorpha subsp. ruderalis]|eukprot:PTQ28803.1 hypothetical protein MARPO_0154s0029 [Marchantia polymorpha]